MPNVHAMTDVERRVGGADAGESEAQSSGTPRFSHLLDRQPRAARRAAMPLRRRGDDFDRPPLLLGGGVDDDGIAGQLDRRSTGSSKDIAEASSRRRSFRSSRSRMRDRMASELPPNARGDVADGPGAAARDRDLMTVCNVVRQRLRSARSASRARDA